MDEIKGEKAKTRKKAIDITIFSHFKRLKPKLNKDEDQRTSIK